MGLEQLAVGWQEASAEVIRELKTWREQHPKATLRDIEATVDEGLGRLRRQMLEEAALVSEAPPQDVVASQRNKCSFVLGLGSQR